MATSRATAGADFHGGITGEVNVMVITGTVNRTALLARSYTNHMITPE